MFLQIYILLAGCTVINRLILCRLLLCTAIERVHSWPAIYVVLFHWFVLQTLWVKYELSIINITQIFQGFPVGKWTSNWPELIFIEDVIFAPWQSRLFFFTVLGNWFIFWVLMLNTETTLQSRWASIILL